LKFKALAKAMGAEKIGLGIAPDGGIAFNVPNEVLERRL
jgi:6-phosphogluconolactonase/glucosamine-6-phosphate isomerase/deaminase